MIQTRIRTHTKNFRISKIEIHQCFTNFLNNLITYLLTIFLHISRYIIAYLYLSSLLTILTSRQRFNKLREMENTYVEVLPSGILPLSSQTMGSMQDDTVARIRSMVQEYRLPNPPSFKCNVLSESPSVDSQNISCATLKRRGSYIISVYL
jgi:hypothetical protein